MVKFSIHSVFFAVNGYLNIKYARDSPDKYRHRSCLPYLGWEFRPRSSSCCSVFTLALGDGVSGLRRSAKQRSR